MALAAGKGQRPVSMQSTTMIKVCMIRQKARFQVCPSWLSILGWWVGSGAGQLTTLPRSLCGWKRRGRAVVSRHQHAPRSRRAAELYAAPSPAPRARRQAHDLPRAAPARSPRDHAHTQPRVAS
eukprot:5955598-Prymnesium_polylepis.1